MRILTGDLDMIETQEEELASLADMEAPGTCAWLLEKPSFIQWRDAQGDDAQIDSEVSSRLRSVTFGRTQFSNQQRPPRFFWLTGLPGSGKTFLAGHVVRNLRDRECSSYFLKHSDKSRHGLAGLLKSLACQMARHDIGIRRSLLSSHQDENLMSESNDATRVWRTLFGLKILRNNFQKRQYWVIDGLDECHGATELLSLFAKIPAHLPLSIFITSRRDVSLERAFTRLPAVAEHININDTLQDIRRYLEENSEDLPMDDGAAVEDLIDKLVLKSNGSFLWTTLTLQRLQNSWTDTAIDKVLEDVPDGMNELYIRILEDMEKGVEKDASNKELTKAILRWVVCAARSLTTAELQEALRLDIGQKVFRLERTIESLCGQLVAVDKQGKVMLVHDTARDFLLDQQIHSDFAIDKESAHARLANKCLQFLMHEHRKPLAPRRNLNNTVDPGTSAFQEYANLHFSDHVAKSTPMSSFGPMNLLERFLETSVLSWIEYIVQRRDLNPLTQTAKNFKTYLNRRIDFQAPLGPSMKTISDWATDLVRLVTAFGRYLLQDPSAIHRIIPPLCPGHSIINRKFGNPHLGLEVTGVSAKGWSDRIALVMFPTDHTTAIACCERRYAVGLKSGIVILYYASTCQEALRLSHGEPVKHLRFSTAEDYIIVAGKTSMAMWNYETGQNTWLADLPSEPLACCLSGDDAAVIVATRDKSIIEWDTRDGSTFDQLLWTIDQDESHLQQQDPHLVHISSELNLLALAYRNEPIALFELTEPTRPRYIEVPTDITSLAFNPVLSMMAIGLFDGELWTFGIWDLRKIAEAKVDATYLAASPDGRTLIAGMTSGNIQIHDFDSLNLLHIIPSVDEEIICTTFTGNGLRFLDIRRHEFNVWEPLVLVQRQDNDDSTSEGQTSFSTAPSQYVQAYAGTEEPLITSMATHHTGDYIFCGKENGTVTVYETKKGRPIKDLYTHLMSSVVHMDWNSAREVLVSSDTSSRILLHRIIMVQTRSASGPRYAWQAQMVLDRRQDQPVRQVLLSADGEYLMVSTLHSEDLWTLDGRVAYSHQCDHPHQTGALSQKWSTNPRHKRQLFEAHNEGVHVLEWEKHSENGPILTNFTVEADDCINSQSRDSGVHFVRVGVEAWVAYDSNPLTRPLVWPTPPSSSSTIATVSAGTLQQLSLVAPEITSLVGMCRSQLVFLNEDDWICSMRLDEAGQQKSRTRHFPIPHCWQSSSRQLLCLVSIKGDVVLAKGEELAIVKRGLLT
jgi:WD40 repeat protein